MNSNLGPHTHELDFTVMLDKPNAELAFCRELITGNDPVHAGCPVVILCFQELLRRVYREGEGRHQRQLPCRD